MIIRWSENLHRIIQPLSSRASRS